MRSKMRFFGVLQTADRTTASVIYPVFPNAKDSVASAQPSAGTRYAVLSLIRGAPVAIGVLVWILA